MKETNKQKSERIAKLRMKKDAEITARTVHFEATQEKRWPLIATLGSISFVCVILLMFI